MGGSNLPKVSKVDKVKIYNYTILLYIHRVPADGVILEKGPTMDCQPIPQFCLAEI